MYKESLCELSKYYLMEPQPKKTKDTSLLSLERKLENGTTQDVILNKFKLKPEMKVKEIIRGKESFNGLNDFLQNFKKSTEEIVCNPEIAEKNGIETKPVNKKGRFIKMNLALGVLDLKPKQKEEDTDILFNKIITRDNSEKEENSSNPLLDDRADQEILKFLMKNSKSRRRIHKIKDNKLNK